LLIEYPPISFEYESAELPVDSFVLTLQKLVGPEGSVSMYGMITKKVHIVSCAVLTLMR